MAATSPLPRSRLLTCVLVSGTGMVALVFVAMAPVLSALAAHLGGGQGGAFVAQMVMSTPAIGLVVGAPLWGLLIGRVGAARVLFAALALYALAGASGLLINDAMVLIVARFFHGIAVAGVATATSALIGVFFHGHAREKVFGIQGAVGAGVALAGVIAAGGLGQIGGWRAPFTLYLLALPALAVAYASLRHVSLPQAQKGPLPQDEFSARPAARGGLSIIVHHFPFYLMTLGMSIVMQMTGIQTGLVLAEDSVHDPAIQSVVLGMASISGVATGIAYGAVRKRISGYGVAFLILSFWCMGQSWIGLSHGALETGAAVALSGIGSGLMMVFLPPLLLARLDQSQHAAGLGLYYSTMFMGDFINPLIMGGLRTIVPDYHAVFLTIGLTCGAFAVVTLISWLTLRGRALAAPST